MIENKYRHGKPNQTTTSGA